ncbi:MAG: hypothetical protein LGR52_06325, partial [Candidatus Thiosymbion ectosymbiont of Robbea hypermnestra]|nr:hypothetical protein [Candidatus Thiosymbion ectosymbiont of Robbea hypermnestra]
PLKMKESGNHNFPIPRRKSPGMGFYDILLSAVGGLKRVKNKVKWGTRAPVRFRGTEILQGIQQS